MPTNLVRDAVADDLDMLRALADPLRWEIVLRLAAEQLCVCHLTEDLGVAQPLVSHHLKVLRDTGLVEGERFRYWTYYRLRPEALHVLAERFDALAVDAPAADDARRPCC
jgi:ArsR family transcriptional regulator, arsenate/arsenite/antimonite-responsive transcriptional repressor